MTTCRRWTTTTSGAGGRRPTAPSTRRPRFWPATRSRALAFEILADPETDPDAETRAALCAGARARGRPRRHGRRADARYRGGRRDDAAPGRRNRPPAGDEDRSAAALQRRGGGEACRRESCGERRAFDLWSGARRGVPDRRRHSRRRGRRMRRWASAPERTPRATRRPWSARSDLSARGASSPAWSTRRNRRSRIAGLDDAGEVLRAAAEFVAARKS